MRLLDDASKCVSFLQEENRISARVDFEKDRIKRLANERGSTPFFDGEVPANRDRLPATYGGERAFPTLSSRAQEWISYARRALENGEKPAYIDDVILRQQIDAYDGPEGFIRAYDKFIRKLSPDQPAKKAKKSPTSANATKSKTHRSTKKKNKLRREVLEKYRTEGLYAIDEQSLPIWLREEIAISGGLMKWAPLYRDKLRAR